MDDPLCFPSAGDSVRIVTDLVFGLLGALMATNQAAAVSNLVEQKTGVSISIPSEDDPVEKEYRLLLQKDDQAQKDIDKWIRDERAFQEKGGGGITEATLKARIEQRLEAVENSYEDFLERNPTHARALLAFGSFLNDQGREGEAAKQWEQAKNADPDNPAAWNNLANYHGHRGPVKKAFEYYAKAIELDPSESVYWYNYAVTVYLFRKDAREFYGIDEQQVFDKAIELYQEAIKRDPGNFNLATDFAQCFYAIKPTRFGEAYKAWDHALSVAEEDFQKQGIYIHYARFKINEGKFKQAADYLDRVTDDRYGVLKERVASNLERKKNAATGPDAK